MGTYHASVDHASRPQAGKKYFTLAEAHRALILVRRIVEDIQSIESQRRKLIDWAGGQLGQKSGAVDDRAIERRFDLLAAEMGRLIDELAEVGVELKDPARGLVDFPAIFEGREILLCWHTNETSINHWHELETGFAGRRPVAELSISPETVG